MDKITSSEFRRRYASLTEPVRVTALGRTIGTWWPVTPAEQWAEDHGLTPKDVQEAARHIGRVVREVGVVLPKAVPPFRPVPKPGLKR